MKKTIALLAVLTMAACLLAGCGKQNTTPTTQAPTVDPEKPTEDIHTDEEAAANVAELIDAIYVQKRTEDTDAQCAAAKAAWDALTDVQKELVEGENADPDYFGWDTGDASLDDPRNADNIGENEILVASFGTSFNGSRAADIKGIEDALQAAFPDWSVRRAFTSQIIINHVQARDGEFIDNMDQALERAINNGVKNLIIQPTHLMHGAEYDELCEALEKVADQFELVQVAEPLLGQTGADAATVNADKAAVAEAITAAALTDAGYETLEAAAGDGVAFVFLGHGTAHIAKVTYSQMQAQVDEMQYGNVFIGTVEGRPAETSCERVIEKVAAAGYKKVILRPLMVVAGDHAENDMAGPGEDSWLSMFNSSGKFESVEAQITGLGSIQAIQELYVAHTADALADSGISVEAKVSTGAALADGVYSADFDSDSGMFRVNEALKGKGTLTVKDGTMTIHISLTSQNIMNLYPGLAGDAKKEGAVILEPTLDTVTYEDGESEQVHGFDVPVPALDEEFDLALIGAKGKWYDHKVSVSNPEPIENP